MWLISNEFCQNSLLCCLIGCFFSEFGDMLRIRREVDKKIEEITGLVQVHLDLVCHFVVNCLQFDCCFNNY